MATDVIVRTGSYGTYYGTTFNKSGALSTAYMQVNAKYIYKYLADLGWSISAIAGMLGNMEAESTLNPGRWQSDSVGNSSGGYGLVQWTPATNYLNWCNSNGLSDPSEMDNNLARIIYELNNGLQWIATDEYPLSFEDFTKSNKSAEYLASAFLKCYERAGVEVEETRRSNASEWYDYLCENSGEIPDTPIVTITRKKKKFNFILFKRKRNHQL